MATNLFDPQSVTTAATIAGIWSPIATTLHLALGQWWKKSPRIRNRALDHLLPLSAIGTVGALILIGYKLGYSINVMSAFGFLASHLGGSVGSGVVYNAQKPPDPATGQGGGALTRLPVVGDALAGILPAGPDNHPDDCPTPAPPAPPAAPPMPPRPPPPPPLPPPPPPHP